MVESEVVFIGHPIREHVISYAPRCATVEPLPALVISHTERIRQHGIADVTEFCGDGAAVSLRCNIIWINHNDPFGKPVHLLILNTAEVQLFLSPLSSFYIPEVTPANREGYVYQLFFSKNLSPALSFRKDFMA